MICLKNSEVNEHQSKKRAQFLVAYDLLSKDEHISLRYIYNAELFNTQSLHWGTECRNYVSVYSIL